MSVRLWLMQVCWFFLMWLAAPQLIHSQRTNQGTGKLSRTACCRSAAPVGMTPLTDNWNMHSKAFQTLSSDSGPFLVRLGVGFFSDPFIPPISQAPQPQHCLVLLLCFIRCFYYQTDYYVYVISIFTADIIAFFMQGPLCLLHNGEHKSHLMAFSSGKPFMRCWMNEQSCCFTKES